MFFWNKNEYKRINKGPFNIKKVEAMQDAIIVITSWGKEKNNDVLTKNIVVRPNGEIYSFKQKIGKEEYQEYKLNKVGRNAVELLIDFAKEIIDNQIFESTKIFDYGDSVKINTEDYNFEMKNPYRTDNGKRVSLYKLLEDKIKEFIEKY